MVVVMRKRDQAGVTFGWHAKNLLDARFRLQERFHSILPVSRNFIAPPCPQECGDRARDLLARHRLAPGGTGGDHGVYFHLVLPL
jgi:hypothetical protein